MREAIAGKKLKWTIEIEVDETWVADGFDMTDESAFEMLNNALRYAYGHEIEARVIDYPSALLVANLQGYDKASHIIKYRKAGKR